MASTAVRALETAPGRVRRTAHRVLGGAPATLTWLAIITFTSIVQGSLPAPRAARILHHVSTNLKNLANLKLRVLAASAFWLDGHLLYAQLLLWAIVFVAVLAPAERWLGTKRWLLVVLISHVGATVITAARLWILIKVGRQPGSLVSAVDVGVSYGVLGIVGLSTYRFPRSWRWTYAVVMATIFLGILRIEHDFVSAGHVAAIFIGFACYPLIPGRSASRAAMGLAHATRYSLPDTRRSAPKTRERNEG